MPLPWCVCACVCVRLWARMCVWRRVGGNRAGVSANKTLQTEIEMKDKMVEGWRDTGLHSHSIDFSFGSERAGACHSGWWIEPLCIALYLLVLTMKIAPSFFFFPSISSLLSIVHWLINLERKDYNVIMSRSNMWPWWKRETEHLNTS